MKMYESVQQFCNFVQLRSDSFYNLFSFCYFLQLVSTNIRKYKKIKIKQCSPFFFESLSINFIQVSLYIAYHSIT